MIHVCFALQDNTGSYSRFTGTALLSLLKNTKSKVIIHLLHDNTLTDDNRDKFIQIAERYGAPLKFYNVEELCAERFTTISNQFLHVKDDRFSIAMFYRLLMPNLLPQEIEKAIYLDSDIIVNLDIMELWQVELGDKPLGAVPNFFQMKDEKASNDRTNKIIPSVKTGFIKQEDYFNSGVLLMNLKVLHNEEDNISEGIRFRCEHPEFRYYDQEILNYCFSTSYLKLPVKFNRYVMLARPENEWIVERNIYHYAAKQYSLGSDINDPFNRLWISYFIQTPWFDVNKELALPGKNIPSRKNYAVSVIIPLYNSEKYIGECLDSLSNQTFQNFEVIVVDDCSTDNSVEVVESYMSKFKNRLKLNKTKINAGSAGIPRNIGLKQASGEYVFFVDADDYIDKIALETLYKAAKENNVEVIYTSAYYCVKQKNNFFVVKDGLGNKLFKEGKPENATLIVDDPDKNLRRLTTNGAEEDFTNPWTKFVRREFLLEHKIFFPDNVVIAEDYIWCIEIYCRVKRFLRLPTPLYFYRRYNESVTRINRQPQDQVSYWFSEFIKYLNALNEMTNRIKLLKENLAYSLGATRHHFNWCLSCTLEERQELKLSNQNIYEMIYAKFANRDDLADFIMPFLSSIINDEKVVEKPLQNFYTLKEEIDQFKRANALVPKSPSAPPAISVIIPMYNVEKYIGECLDSLLLQTFQDFEVIIVDDGSTDSSCTVIESYMPKFNERLSLYPMGENTGHPGERRNFGLSHARGEYVYFMDSDDVLIQTGLGEMYSLAKEYDSDVVYCERYYRSTGIGEEFRKNISVATDAQGPPYVDKPTLESPNLSERLPQILNKRFFPGPVFKVVRRDLLNEHKIFFPAVKPGEDDIWTYGLVFFAKRFLRVPNMIYVRRIRNDSVMGTAKSPKQAVSFWLTPILLGLKELDKFMEQIEFFQQNPQQRYAILENRLKRNLYPIQKYAGQCNPIDVYETIQNDFNKHFGNNDVLVSTLCSRIFEQDKILNGTELCPTVSVIISMYNSEKYIGECLDSILAQTFQSFEVIVVDDCSTDSSVEVVKSYASKFNGRMKLAKTQINSGRPGEPRNIGVDLSRGKYLLILDSDDTITPDAIEKLYSVAKDFNADVVACEKFYRVPEDVWNDLEARKQLEPYSYQRGGFVSEASLVSFDIAKRVQDYREGKFLYELWDKLIRRDYLVENQIRSQTILGNDFLMSSCLIFTAKRIARVPYVVNFYRQHKDSIYNSHNNDDCEPLTRFKAYTNSLNIGFKYLDALLSKQAFFQKNPHVKYLALQDYLRKIWAIRLKNVYNKIPVYNLKVALREEFGGSDNVEFIAFLFETLYEAEKEKSTQMPVTFQSFVTARLDIKMNSTVGDFQIHSFSDKGVTVNKPAWAQTNGIGYTIQSRTGKLEFIAKATANGKVNLRLRGIDVRDPENNSKRIPYWIDYTKLTVNGEVIFDAVTPAWHDKPYSYNMDVKADEEIKIEVEWLPHRDDRFDLSLDATKEQEKNAEMLRKSEALVSELRTALDNEKKIHGEDVELIRKFSDYFTARLDFKLVPDGEGDFQIVSVSDKKATVREARWLPAGEIGYSVQSYIGKMELVGKVIGSGQFNLYLKGMDVRDPDNKSKRIPYWIDYTKLIVNGEVVFDKITPVWHDKSYTYTLDIKADEEIKIEVEWLPHSDKQSEEQDVQIAKELAEQKALVSELRADLDTEKKSSEEQNALVSELRTALDAEKKVHGDDVELIRKFSNYFTARLDCKLILNGEGDFQIVSVSDEKAAVKKARWLSANEVGYSVQSYVGKMEIVAKVVGGGQFNLNLKGMDIRDPQNKRKRLPYWIDYTKLTVNGQNIFDSITPVWHDKPYSYALDVNADEEIKIEVEWLPHSDKKSEEQDVQVAKKLEEQSVLISELQAALDTEKKSASKQNALVSELRTALDSGKKAASKQNALVSELRTALDSEKKSADEQNALVTELRTALDAEKKVHGDDVELIRKFSNYFTARLDCKLILNGEGDFQIVSVSDEKAAVKKARWLSANEVGYSVQSYVGKMEIVGKVTGGGQFNLNLKGKDIRDPQNKRKRVPYWIDYTKLTINGEIVFDELTPVWHDKPYSYALDVNVDEEIKIEVEWLPHSDKQSEEQDVQVAKKLEEQSALISELQAALDSEKKSSDEQNALVAELRTELDNEKKATDEQNALVSELRAALDNEKKVHGDDVELIRKFSNYFTARLDFKLMPSGEGDFKILSVSDEKAVVKKARGLSANEVGYSVQSYVGKMEIVGKVTGGGQFNLNLKGKDVRDPQNKKKRIPYWIDYTNLTVNGEVILDKVTPVWHNEPYNYIFYAKADEEIRVEVEWVPHKGDN